MVKTFAFRALGLFALAAPLTAAAQDAVPLSVEIDGSVSAYVESMADGVLDAPTVLAIKSLAHQKAVAISCDAFEVDSEKFQAAFNKLFPPPEEFDAMPEDAQLTIQTVAILTVGTFLGAHLAVAETDLTGFCANAEVERADPAAENLVWAAKN